MESIFPLFGWLVDLIHCRRYNYFRLHEPLVFCRNILGFVFNYTCVLVAFSVVSQNTNRLN